MKKIILFLIISINVADCFVVAKSVLDDITTQGYTPTVVPPSPEAYKFSTFGNIPLNGSTGGFSYSVPLYTITDKDISLPITLDYYSNGVKIDELAGIVGTDWNLNAGGVISRIMRGKPDENSVRWYPENIQEGIKETDEKVYDVARGYSNIDVERDWFSFNVNGISGTFYFDENLQPIINSKEYVKIIFNDNGGLTTSSFTLIDNKGYQYIFEDREISKPSSLGIKSEPIEDYVSSWFLTKIISPCHNEINLTYIDNRFSYVPGITFNLLYDKECNSSGLLLDHVFHYNEYVSFNTIRSKVVSKIIFSNGSVNFDYNINRPDGRGLSLKNIRVEFGNELVNHILFKYETVYTNLPHPVQIINDNDNIRNRLFLKSIHLLGNQDNLGSEEHKYVFDYYEKEQLPIRLSPCKDEFGYHNGSRNNTVFSSQLSKDKFIALLFSRYGNYYATANREVNPDVVYYGMLKKIEYPTGGYSEVRYEANSTLEKATELKYINTSSLYVRKGENISTNENSASLAFTANGTDIYFTANASLVSGEPDDHDQYRLVIKNITENTVILNKSALFGERLVTEDYATLVQNGLSPVSTKQGCKYEITLSLESKNFNTASAGMQIQYNADTITYDKIVYGGGARVKDISDYVSTKYTDSNRRSFYYSALDNYPNAKTSLNRLIKPQPYTIIPYIRNCIIGHPHEEPLPDDGPVRIWPVPSEKIIISSSTVDLMYNNRKQSSYYTAITEFQEKGGTDNGAIEKHFLELNSDYAAKTIFQNGITSVPYSNASDAYYGLLRSESVFEKKSDKYSLRKTKTYTYTSLDLNLLSSYIFQQNYPIPQFVPTPSMLELGIQTVTGAKYFNYIENVKCTSSIESIYDGNENLKTEITNVYGGSPYFNMKEQSVTSSTKAIQKKKYLYAPDLVGQLSFMNRLIEDNRIGTPVITEIRRKNTDGSEQQIYHTKTTFAQFAVQDNKGITKEFILPEFIYSPTVNDKRIAFSKYDTYGNIIHYTLDDATKIVYLWGYNGQYPIAEIKNATYDQVKTALGATPESLSSAVTPDYSKIEALRTNTNLPNALITTYTYKPLVGMTSMTDPRGVTTTYEYDLFGRLATVKDTNGKVIQAYDYHYQNQ